MDPVHRVVSNSFRIRKTAMSSPLTLEPQGLASPGVQWIVDAFHCDRERLRDRQWIVNLCLDVIAGLQLTVIGTPQVHAFPPPGGVTGLFLLSESHLAVHTYPEFELATFNLYCCRDEIHWPWQEFLQDRLTAMEVSVREAARGIIFDDGRSVS
jgi:S-adenosylmethionine decarboxylase